MTSSSGPPSTYTSTLQFDQSGNPSANKAPSPYPHLQTSYLSTDRLVTSLSVLCQSFMFLAVLLRLLLPFISLTRSGLFNGKLEVYEAEALDFFTLSRFILKTLSIFKNPIFTRLPLSRFLNSQLCNLIAQNPGLSFCLLMACTAAVPGVNIFVRQGLFFFELSTSSLSSLDPYFH